LYAIIFKLFLEIKLYLLYIFVQVFELFNIKNQNTDYSFFEGKILFFFGMNR